MQVYRLSKAVPLGTLIRAYELWCSTDMSKCEVARALGVNERTLTSTMQKAEEGGLWTERKVSGVNPYILDYLRNQPGKTCRQIAKATGLERESLNKRVSYLYKRKELRRVSIPGSKGRFKYYVK